MQLSGGVFRSCSFKCTSYLHEIFKIVTPTKRTPPPLRRNIKAIGPLPEADDVEGSGLTCGLTYRSAVDSCKQN